MRKLLLFVGSRDLTFLCRCSSFCQKGYTQKKIPGNNPNNAFVELDCRPNKKVIDGSQNPKLNDMGSGLHCKLFARNSFWVSSFCLEKILKDMRHFNFGKKIGKKKKELIIIN